MARIGVLTAWLSRRNGGVFEAVVAHAGMLRDAGFEPVVIGLDDEYAAADRARLGDVEVIACPVSGPRQLGYALSMASRLRDTGLDLVHLHGIWTYPSAVAVGWAGSTGRPLVVSPHGMLDRWIVSRGIAKKAVAKMAFERRCWRRATLFHALTEAEAKSITVATGRTAIAVVSNAVVPAPRGAPVRAPSALYLGRIHPKKNVEVMIDAWAAAADVLRPIGAELVIAGWGDDDHVTSLQARIAAHPGDDVRFVGSLFGDAKHDQLAGARFLVLASQSEGLPMAVLEAWACGTPTLMSVHCNLPAGFRAGAAIDCGTDRITIAAALRCGFGADAVAWTAMSDAAVDLAEADFAPAGIAAQWVKIYEDLLAGARSRVSA